MTHPFKGGDWMPVTLDPEIWNYASVLWIKSECSSFPKWCTTPMDLAFHHKYNNNNVWPMWVIHNVIWMKHLSTAYNSAANILDACGSIPYPSRGLIVRALTVHNSNPWGIKLTGKKQTVHLWRHIWTGTSGLKCRTTDWYDESGNFNTIFFTLEYKMTMILKLIDITVLNRNF